jgi:beta-phosphoglucomutase family hydrolase
VLGLPDHVTACLFDLDGVLTQTATVHNAAWAETFDAYLRRRSAQTGEPFQPFDPHEDYPRYVDGRPRADGVRTFLASRGITLPEGSPDDPPDADTVNGIGNRKNVILVRRIREDGVRVYDGSVAYVHAAKQARLACAVVSASANTPDILKITKLAELMDAVVDGNVARRLGLRGKPYPDTFAYAAEQLGARHEEAAVFEDAIAGVQAGRSGNFGYVVGVDRVGRHHAEELRAAGADIVVQDLSELLA